MKLFLQLTKSGIVGFVLLTGFAGYALSHEPYSEWNWLHLAETLLALYFFSAGSFALNQAQEWQIDKLMPRTTGRPIPSGKITVLKASIIGFTFLILGVVFGWLVNLAVMWLGVATVLLYNILYTLYWKRKWAFGAVPGAIPGAMPVVIGYAANSSHLTNPELIYAFLIMFFWQMPHFWALAIRFRDDYSKGGIPVLPTQIGTDATLFHIGMYMFAYIGLAVASPWITSAYLFYPLLVIPISVKVLIEFFRYYREAGQKGWLPFFLWTNLSVLIFLLGPVLDKWFQHHLHQI